MGVYSNWLYLWFTFPGLGGGLLCLAISVVYVRYPGLGGGLLCLGISVVYLP